LWCIYSYKLAVELLEKMEITVIATTNVHVKMHKKITEFLAQKNYLIIVDGIYSN
jgi:hypothetical protein